MTPAEVPDDLVIKAAKAVYQAAEHRAECDGTIDSGDWEEWDPESPFFAELLMEQRVALAAVLPVHKQQVTAKYRRFVKEVRVIAEGDAGSAEISPPELRQALTDLRHGRS